MPRPGPTLWRRVGSGRDRKARLGLVYRTSQGLADGLWCSVTRGVTGSGGGPPLQTYPTESPCLGGAARRGGGQSPLSLLAGPTPARSSGICRFRWPALRPTGVFGAHLPKIVRLSFDRPAPVPVSSDEYPFFTSARLQLLRSASRFPWRPATDHVSRPLILHWRLALQAPGGVLIGVGSRLRACSPLVRLSLSPSLRRPIVCLGIREVLLRSFLHQPVPAVGVSNLRS